jgi:hypothetical protein
MKEGENKMKKLGFIIGLTLILGFAVESIGAEFAFHGDMNNRFLIYTDRSDWLANESQGEIGDKKVDATYGELKYRFWFEAADDDGDVKGVYAIEIGGVRWGREGTGRSQGGSFSGDGANVETRWAYVDLQTPGVERKLRWRMGLQPWKINSFLWQETATGLNLYGTPTDLIDFQAAWIRSIDKLAQDESDRNLEDVDNILGRVNFNVNPDLKIGVFGLYTWGDNDADVATAPDPNPAGLREFAQVTPRNYLYKAWATDAKSSWYNIGVDGSWTYNKFFVNWDLIYQGGKFEDINFDDSEFSGLSSSGDFDISAWMGHADIGYKFGKPKLTYTFWYASGDDDAGDDDFNGFLGIDLDRDDSLSMFEGNYADDASYFTERGYLLDKGFIMNKLALDYQWTEKLRVGGAVMYMMTAEDIDYFNANGGAESNDQIGFEVNGYAKYMIFKNVELAVNAGYLFSGDAMDAFETGKQRDGSADEDIFVSSARVRYKF